MPNAPDPKPTAPSAPAPASAPPPRKPAPWCVPEPVKGVEATPSCNPNYRPVLPPEQAPPVKPVP